MSNPVTIIMIEDDEGHARLIERNIRRSGVNNEIVPFTNGTAAMDYLFGQDGAGAHRKGEALLVLLDLNLPGDTGWDLIRGPALAAGGGPPVVLTSATTVSPKRLAEYHVAGYLPKPFPLETLVATVSRFVRPEGEPENQ